MIISIQCADLRASFVSKPKSLKITKILMNVLFMRNYKRPFFTDLKVNIRY